MDHSISGSAATDPRRRSARRHDLVFESLKPLTKRVVVGASAAQAKDRGITGASVPTVPRSKRWMIATWPRDVPRRPRARARLRSRVHDHHPIYVAAGGAPWIASVFYGVAPAAIAIVAYSAWRLAAVTLGRDLLLLAVAGALFALTLWSGSELFVAFIAAGMVVAVARIGVPTFRDALARARKAELGGPGIGAASTRAGTDRSGFP